MWALPLNSLYEGAHLSHLSSVSVYLCVLCGVCVCLCVCFGWLVLRLELRTSHMLSPHSTTELYASLTFLVEREAVILLGLCALNITCSHPRLAYCTQ